MSLKIFCDAPIKNGGLKRLWMSMQNNSCRMYGFLDKKLVVKCYLIGFAKKQPWWQRSAWFLDGLRVMFFSVSYQIVSNSTLLNSSSSIETKTNGYFFIFDNLKTKVLTTIMLCEDPYTFWIKRFNQIF